MALSMMARAGLVAHVLKWRFTWGRHDSNYVPPGVDNPKFMSAIDAVRLIKDGDTVLSCGMAANARCSAFYFALRELFEETGHPKGLTWVGVGAMGGRGRVPGTIEELDFPEIIDRYIGGHLETMKAQLRLAQEGHIEMQTMPQGVMAELFELQAKGEYSLVSDVGVGTFLDPRVGSGTNVAPGVGESLVEADGDRLRYHMPPINVAMMNLPYADREGNIYSTGAATLTENRGAVRAARANNGKVLVTVYNIIDKNESEIYMPAAMVDAVVANPYSEQTGSVPMKRYWPLFTVNAKEDQEKSIARLKFINEFLKITPTRRAPELAVARLAGTIFTEVADRGAEVNIGVGLPEEVCRLIREGGLEEDVNFATETGVSGGLPAPGVFFGAAVNPQKMMSSYEIFKFWEDNLDVTILGLLEADSEGNVNVSKRGEGPINYVGPGGFPNLVHSAKAVIFIGTWMANARFEIRDGKVVIAGPGDHKFKQRVDQITFSGKRALEMGKKVYYVTNVGAFRLTERGMEISHVMPGLDVDKDIIGPCPMDIVLPESGAPKVVDRSIVTGEGFRLSWPD